MKATSQFYIDLHTFSFSFSCDTRHNKLTLSSYQITVFVFLTVLGTLAVAVAVGLAVAVAAASGRRLPCFNKGLAVGLAVTIFSDGHQFLFRLQNFERKF